MHKIVVTMFASVLGLFACKSRQYNDASTAGDAQRQVKGVAFQCKVLVSKDLKNFDSLMFDIPTRALGGGSMANAAKDVYKETFSLTKGYEVEVVGSVSRIGKSIVTIALQKKGDSRKLGKLVIDDKYTTAFVTNQLDGEAVDMTCTASSGPTLGGGVASRNCSITSRDGTIKLNDLEVSPTKAINRKLSIYELEIKSENKDEVDVTLSGDNFFQRYAAKGYFDFVNVEVNGASKNEFGGNIDVYCNTKQH